MTLASYEKQPGSQPPRLVQLDSRGRLSLQRYTGHNTFQLIVEEDGEIRLIPSVVIAAYQGPVATLEA